MNQKHIIIGLIIGLIIGGGIGYTISPSTDAFPREKNHYAKSKSV
jgi:hypothetical protein